MKIFTKIIDIIREKRKVNIDFLRSQLAIEYEKLSNMFLNTEIYEDKECINNIIKICDRLKLYEDNGIKVIDHMFLNNIELPPFCNNISELKNKAIELDRRIKETNIRKKLYNSAKEFEKRNDLERAIKINLQILKIYPWHLEPIFSIARIYQKKGQQEKAINFLEEMTKSPYYKGSDSICISYRYNIDKKILELKEESKVLVSYLKSDKNTCNRYVEQLMSDKKKNIDYNKKSKIVSIFTKKWRNICKDEFVVIDFETTGLDKVYDKIVEISAIRYKNNKEVEKYVTLVNPQINIDKQISNINHITNNMVKNKPTEKEVIPKLVKFIGNSLIVGHNVNFDIGFLEIAAQRQGMQVEYKYIDTLSISKKLFPQLPNYKLGTIASYMGLETSNLHRAETDTRVCAEIISYAFTQIDNLEHE